jgi:predicted O-methyltransferase YrrM
VIVTDAVDSYLAGLRPAPDPVLAEMELHAARDRIPVVVPPAGALLQVLALACGARRVLEVGTAIGVSTLYIARGMAAGGTVVSFEVDQERHAAARDYLDRAGVLDRVDLRLRDAREGIRELEGRFDMAFIDGVKAQYDDYLGAIVPLLAPGAVLAVDNVLMSGAVAGEPTARWSEEAATNMREFTRRVLAHPELTAAVTPVGDGVLVAVRR